MESKTAERHCRQTCFLVGSPEGSRGLAGHLRTGDGAALAAITSRTGKISSERFCFQEKNKSECKVELPGSSHSSAFQQHLVAEGCSKPKISL